METIRPSNKIDITNNYTTNDIVKPDDFIQEETFLGDDEDDDICFDDI